MRITREAHDLTEDFIASIAEDYSVTVVDETNSPWAVIFEGEPTQLEQMVSDHWGEVVVFTREGK